MQEKRDNRKGYEKVVQVMKIEEKDEDEGEQRGYVNYPTVQQYIFMPQRQKCIETINTFF